MPKLLNVEKLESKFQNLSRSRESIQGLSAWIMHHKEVYQEIAEHWLICISKNINTLAMFYVANEVIQGCGKKKCPEYREAFSKVLDEATSYEHVKEIKEKIFRLLNLWKERKLFDDDFYQRIENNLNSTEKEESSDDESEEELSELEIIKQFKKQNLINELETLKSIEFKRKEKEEILNYADAPELANLDEVIVRLDCQDTLKKCDTYLTLVTDFTKLISKEISLRKKLLKELKKNCIFYNAQQKDVKEVANAFRIYGKRVKNVETRLAEKITTFPVPSASPCFSEDISVSPDAGASSYDTDDASKNTLSSINELDENYFCGSGTWKESLSFSGKVPTEAVSVQQPYQDNNLKESIVCEFPISEFSNVTEVIEETKSQSDSTFSRQGSNSSDDARNTLDKRIMNIFPDQTNICDEKIIKQTDVIKEIKSSQSRTKLTPDKKKTFLEKEQTRLLDEDVNSSTGFEYQTEKTLVESNSVLPILQTHTTDQKEQLDSKHNKSQAQSNEDVDDLLEESYSKISKTKLSYKRKIELLLKTKGKKQCNNQPSQELSEKVSMKNDSSPLGSMEVESKYENQKDNNTKMYDHTKTPEISKLENSETVSKIIEGAEERSSKCLKTSSEMHAVSLGEKIDSASSLITSISDNGKDCDKSLIINNTSIDSDLCSNNNNHPENETLPFNPSGTFTGTAMSSFMSNFSADLASLKSTDKNSKNSKQSQAENFAFNPIGTFTVTDISSLMSTNTSSEDPHQSERETLPSDTFNETELSSFMSGMSTDFLKNILQKNQQNTQTNTTDESDPKTSGTPSEGKSDSPLKKVASNIPYNLTNNDMSIEECSMKDYAIFTDVRQANSQDISQTSATDISSENVKAETQVLFHNTHNSDITSKSEYSDKSNSSLNANEVEEENLSIDRDNIQTVSSENFKQSKNDAVLNKKPSLLGSLQDVLLCLSENIQSKCDMKTPASKEYKELEPPLRIESMLKIYKYLHSDDAKFINNSNCLEINSNTSNTNPVSIVKASIDNNYEVMDMECDSEEDT